ncbi:hypothetical protein HII31_00491 [Pseudocercospora fuligena]|uniref:Uncharacterized protein n=1 Tax=Pseudocercospora fuligena TaxID=685502 RepID=A0A8H6RUJ5_9PEZI|nr:hypothetical protein HII31_00491 [Pseudocercospora fuligena]
MSMRHSHTSLAGLHDLKCIWDRKRSSSLLQVADGRMKIDRLYSGLTGKLLLSATPTGDPSLATGLLSIYAKRGLIITHSLGGITLSGIVVDLILAGPVALNGLQALAAFWLNLDLVKLHSRCRPIAARTWRQVEEF